jgi:hypothetical protein
MRRRRHIRAILILLEPHGHHMFKAAQKIKAITTKGGEDLESMCGQK